MADFDLSMAITADGDQAVAEIAEVERAQGRLTSAEKTGEGQARRSAGAAGDVSKRLRDQADAINRVVRATNPAVGSQRTLEAAVRRAERAYIDGKISLAAYTRAQEIAARASFNAAGAHRVNATGVNQLGMQVNDAATMMMMGARPAQVFASQAGQVGLALSQMGGGLGRVGAFLMGPWGVAITIGIMALGLLVEKLWDGEKKAKALTRAQELQRMSSLELVDAIKEQNKALGEAVRVGREAENQAVASANAVFLEAQRRRQNTVDALKEAKALLEVQKIRASGPGQSSEIAALGLASISDRIAGLEAKLVKAEAALADSRTGITLARIPLLRRDVEERTDPAKAIEGRYERGERAARAQMEADIRRGRTRQQAEARYTQSITRLAEAREREEKALQESRRKPRRTPAEDGDLTAFQSPIPGAGLGSRFGPRWGKQHRGVDIPAAPGTEVHAAAAGTIIEIGNDPGGYGNYVIIDHGRGTTTRYAHLLRTTRAKGSKVEAGDVFALSGGAQGAPGAGNARGRGHLHYEVRRGGRAVDPTKGSFPTDPLAANSAADRIQQAAERARQQAEDLAQWGEQQAARLQGMADRFLPQPRLVEQSRAALAQLDGVLAEIQQRKPPNMAELLADAREARVAIEQGIHQPFLQLIAEREREIEIQALVTAGREAEAEALRVIQGLQRDVGALLPEQVAAIHAIATARRMEARAAQQEREEQEKALRSVDDVREAFRGLFDLSGKGIKEFPQRILRAFEQSIGDRLFDKIFGKAFQRLEDQGRGVRVVEDASQKAAVAIDTARDAVARLGQAAETAADALAGGPSAGSSRIDAIAAVVNGLPDDGGPSSPAAAAGSLTSFMDRVAAVLEAAPAGGTASSDKQQRLPRDPVALFSKIFEDIAKSVFGERAARAIGKTIVTGLEGAAVGSIVGPLLSRAAGGKGSKTGGAIGGALGAIGGEAAGNALGGPLGGQIGKALGAVVGSFLGSTIGGMLKKSKYASASVSDTTSAAGVVGNNKGSSAQASALGSSVQSGLDRIAEALGVQLGAFNVSIGVKDGKFRVDPTGRGIVKTKKGAKDYGEDEAAAVGAAIADAISDGAFKNASAAVQRALQKYGSDLDRGLREALKVQEVEILLGGVGAAFEKTFNDLERQLAERVRIAREYGFDVVKMEELNAKERADTFNRVMQDRIGDLQNLLKDMDFGSLFEGTLSDQRLAIIGQIATERTAAERGDEGSASRLADLERRLLEVSREAYGTAGPELAADRASAKADAERIIALETQRAREAQERATAHLNAATTTAHLMDEANAIAARQLVRLEEIALFLSGGGGGGNGGGSFGDRNGPTARMVSLS